MNEPIRVKNTGTEEVPAFGIMRVEGIERQSNNGVAYKVRSIQLPPETPGHAIILINSAKPLETGGDARYGWARDAATPGWVAYDDADGTPSFGAMWGVEDEDFKLRADAPGFEIFGVPDLEKKRVIARKLEKQSVYLQLTASLSAAGDMLTTPSTAAAVVLIPDEANPGQIIAGSAITLTNRWEDLSLDSGKRGYAEWSWLYLEWIQIATECP